MKPIWKWVLVFVLFTTASGCQGVIDLTCWGNCDITIGSDTGDDGDDHDKEGTVADPDGNIYRWKLMDDGNKWLVDNLRYEASGSWIYPEESYPEDIPYDPDLYGRFYTWEAARMACEALGDGWHLPTGFDWDSDTPGEWDNLAGAYGYWIQTTANVYAYDALLAPGQDPARETGSSGFDALLGGSQNSQSLGRQGFYWSAAEANWSNPGDAAFFYTFDRDYGVLNRGGSFLKSMGLSCRCVRH